MSMAGLEGNEFYFQDDDGKRLAVFSLEEVSEENKGLPLDIMMATEGHSRREVLLQVLLSGLRSLGDKGEQALGESLVLLSMTRYLNSIRGAGDFLLLGECESSSFARALAKVMECFSLDSRLYCLGEGKGRESGRSSLISLPQELSTLNLPVGRFCGVILSDGTSGLPKDVLSKAFFATNAGGIVCCLSANNRELHESFLACCPEAEIYRLGGDITLYWQTVSEDFAAVRYKAAYPGLAMCPENAKTQPSRKKTVLFMPYAFSQWEKMKPLYEQLMSEKDSCTALVMPVPYGEKDEKGTVVKVHYEGDFFSQECDVLDYRGVDIAALHPDVIVLDHAYDRSDARFEVDDFHFAERLCHVADKIVCLSEVDGIIECLRGGGHSRRILRMEAYCPLWRSNLAG